MSASSPSSKFHAPPRPFDELGPYVLVERLGAGGMGEVWMAQRQTGVGSASKTVALKLCPRPPGAGEARLQFESEARLSMMLSHSNIVQVFDVGESGAYGYMAMEWVDGLDLASLIRELSARSRLLSFELTGYIIGEVIHALSYAHGLREGQDGKVLETIIHRDISPHNVLTSVCGEVKLSDFGVARLSSEETSGVHVRGKLRYMPPEQLAGHSRAPATDLFAVGAVLHELLSGRGFRIGLRGDDMLAAVASGQVPPLERPEIPSQLLALHDALLVSDPKWRPQSADEALALLGSWAGDLSCRPALAEIIRELSGVRGPRSGLSLCGGVPELRTQSSESALLSPAALSVESLSSSALTYVESAAPLPARPKPLGRRLAPYFAGGVLLALGLHPFGESELEARALPDPLEASSSARARAQRSLVHEHAKQELPTPEPALLSVRALAPERAPGPQRARRRGGASAKRREPLEASPGASPASAAPAPTESAPAQPAPAPSQVTFTSGEFHWLEIRVAGTPLSLDPRASISLAPGRHRVELRQGQSAWLPAGSVEVEAGRRYRVDLLRPASVRVTALAER